MEQKILIEQKQTKSVFEVVNYVFAILLALLPAIQVVVGFFVEQTYFSLSYLIWAFVYICVFFAFSPRHIKWLKSATTKSKLVIACLCVASILFCLNILSSIVNLTFNIETFFIVSYFFVFACIITLDKKQLKVFFHILLAVLCVISLLNICDPSGTFFHGFVSSDPCNMAAVFFHSNYSATIIAMMIVVCFNLLLFCKNKWLNILYIVYFLVFAVFLYMNAAFASITAVFFVMVVEFVVLWIITKKCPWKIILFFLSFASVSLLLELIPNIDKHMSSPQNYFVELVAVFDNIFHTNLLQTWFHIETVPGADGWSRGDLLKNSLLAAIGGSNANFGTRLKTILFGVGSNSTEVYRPHNMFVSYWLEYGLVASMLHYALIVLMLVFMQKGSKQNKEHTWPFFFACIAYLFITIFGSLVVYHYIYFVIMLAIGIKVSQSSAE